MSSHLSASANYSTLRFIFEECGLFLSEKSPPRSGVASTASVDLKRDYVNVIQLGLFELSLKTSDKVIFSIFYCYLTETNSTRHLHKTESESASTKIICFFLF